LHQVLIGRPLVRPRQGERPRRPRTVFGRFLQYATSLQTGRGRMIFVKELLLLLSLFMFKIEVTEINKKCKENVVKTLVYFSGPKIYVSKLLFEKVIWHQV
jgi:hypothetical protein